MARKILLAIISATIFLSHAPQARADAGRDFLMSALYGTLAGTLIGAASLALADDPSEKMQRIARGASLGLYAGILLGAYIVYAVPDENEDLNNILPEDQQQEGGGAYYPIFYPTISDSGKIDGAGVALTVLQF